MNLDSNFLKTLIGHLEKCETNWMFDIKELLLIFLVSIMLLLWLGFKWGALVCYRCILSIYRLNDMMSRICLKTIHSYGVNSERVGV